MAHGATSLLEWIPNQDDETMSRPSWLQKLYWSFLSKPVEERELVKFLLQQPISSVLEVGVGDGSRMQRIAKLVQLTAGTEQLRYIGIDPFEAATDGRVHLRLKQAHQLATQLGFKASLVPGDHASAIPRVAHKMAACDLVIIDGGLNPQSPAAGTVASWMNRLSHPNSTIIACNQPGEQLCRVPLSSFETSSGRMAA